MTDGNSSGGGNEVQTSPTRATQPPNTKNKSRHAQAAWFVGERTLKPKFVHIDDHGLLRMFTTPSNSELPHHGLTLHKYNESLTTKLQTGPDNDGLYETERGGKKRTYDEVEADALQDAKDITADDKCYLWAVVKNLMASRMSWKGTNLHIFAIEEALGIGRDFADRADILWDVRKNRDNCQSDILNGAHECVLEFLATPIGKEYINENKGKPWKIYNRSTKSYDLVLIDHRKLNKAGFFNMETAKKVYADVIDFIDMSKLVNADNTPTYLGKCLMVKAKALIQLELCYVCAHWIDAATGEYTRRKQHHCRDVGTILAYLKTIDEDTMQRKKIKVMGPGGKKIETEVMVLFPMPKGKIYSSTRSSKNDDTKICASRDDARVVLGDNPSDIEDSDAEEEDEED